MLSLRPLVALLALAAVSGCATIKPYMRYQSDRSMPRGPLSVRVEVTADREAIEALSHTKDYKGRPLFEPRDMEAVTGTFRDALRKDIGEHGPVRIDDVKPDAVLRVRLTRIAVDPPYQWSVPRYVLPVFGILGVPTGMTSVDVRAETQLVAGGKNIAEFASSADRSTVSGFYYNWEVTFAPTARVLGERIRGELEARQGPIAASMGLAPVAPTGAAARLSLAKATRILVLPMRPAGGASKDTCGLLTNYLLSRLFEVERLSTISKDDVAAMLDAEKQKDLLGCSEATCMAQIGGVLGADLVLATELGAVGSKYNLNASVIDAGKGAVAARASLVLERNEDALLAGVPRLVTDVVAKLNEPEK